MPINWCTCQTWKPCATKQQSTLEEDDVEQWLAVAPLCPGAEYLNALFVQRLWSTLQDTFRRLMKTYDGTVEAFIHAYSPTRQLAGRIFFHLVENTKGPAPFAFLVTYATRLGGDGTARHLPLKYALQEYGNDRDKLLELLGTVYRAARTSTLLPPLLESGDIFHPLGWEPQTAYTFLQEVPLYEQSGILCRIPNWWSAKAAGASLRVNIGTAAPTFVGMDAVLDCAPSLSINGVPITAEEARRLLQESEGLALIKNKWVVVDKAKLQQTLEAYEQVRTLLEDGGLTLREALALQLSPTKQLGDEHAGVDIGVSYGTWLEDITRKLLNPQLVTAVAPANTFRATLRPYQQAGLNWLGFLDALGFGACLADDMGLGKTIQLLAFLSVKKPQKTTSLLVVPASLIANWRSEIDRCYPELAYYIAHPGSTPTSQQAALSTEALAQYDLVITTYAMVQRYDVLQTFHWDYVILDEAQAIKNPGTHQTRAVKKLHAANRIVLTGTPVENRLSDLWSLFDFLNPGLLGNLKEFKTFAKHLHDDPAGYGRLRQVIRPYILRRLKTDTSIISDLPDKVEMKTFASLSKKQIILYRDLLDEHQRLPGPQRRHPASRLDSFVADEMQAALQSSRPVPGHGRIRGTAQRQIPTPPGTLRDGPGETRKNARVHAIQGNHRGSARLPGRHLWACRPRPARQRTGETAPGTRRRLPEAGHVHPIYGVVVQSWWRRSEPDRSESRRPL